jgi:lactoylglutathione lyase
VNPQSAMEANVEQSVPFLGVSNIDSSIRFYVDGLGFKMARQWTDQGKLRWCWLQNGGAALMLQQFRKNGRDSWMPEGKVGEGVSIYFICKDALAIYHELSSRGVKAQTPFVGNGLWVVGLTDPDGYKLFFESPTGVPEETIYAGS